MTTTTTKADAWRGQVTPDLAALERMLAEATPGEWRNGSGYGSGAVVASDCAVYINVDRENVGIGQDTIKRWQADARLITAMHSALPALIAEIRRLRAIETAARGLLDLVEVDTAGVKMRTRIRAATLRNLFDEVTP